MISRSPGKLILTGEHSVVYGKPALIGAIDLNTRVELEALGGDRVTLQANDLEILASLSIDELTSWYREAQDGWQRFNETGDDSAWKEIRRDPLYVIKGALGIVYDEFRMCGGTAIKVKSTIPIGSGLGSSASVAVAIIGGMGKLFDLGWSLEEVNERAHKVEQLVHGKPSGGDNTAVVYGGFLRFEKRKNQFNFDHLAIPKKLPSLNLIHSGTPKENTGEMVILAKPKLDNTSLIERVGKLSEQVIESFKKNKVRWEWIQENERLLEELGVVGEKAQKMIRQIEKSGGVAKVCGAGGVVGGSGMLLTYHQDEDALKYLVESKKWTHYKVILGAEGWRIK